MNLVPWQRKIILPVLFFFFICASVYAKDNIMKPKEPGVYIKANKGLARLLPNIVFEEQGVYFIEPTNNTPHFLLKDVEHLVLFGTYDMNVLTFNPMTPFRLSGLGKPRYMFGRDINIDVKQIGANLYTIKPKGLLGRGYHSLWINENAWDFILD